jgi:hypothetical protein
MCQDGGTIWECDQKGCQRAVCEQCIEVPAEELKKFEGQNLQFTCVACHWSWGGAADAYFASVFTAVQIYLIIFYFIFTGVFN